jgi:hypothetical protein
MNCLTQKSVACALATKIAVDTLDGDFLLTFGHIYFSRAANIPTHASARIESVNVAA